MGRSRSRSKSHKKKEKKSKHKKDRSRSRSKPRRQRTSKFSLGPQNGMAVPQSQDYSMQPQQQQQQQTMYQKPNQNDLQIASQYDMQIDSSMLQIGGGGANQNGGVPLLEISKPQMTEQDYMKQNGIPENPNDQTMEQKVKLNQFRQEQEEKQKQNMGNMGLDGALQIGSRNNVQKSILTRAGLLDDDEDEEEDQPGLRMGNQPLQINFNPLSLNNMGASSSIYATLNDPSKLKRKIFVPQNGFNFTGLIIGPQGSNQKKMEEYSGCKILVRGKGSQKEGQPPQFDDNEDQHVLIVGDSEQALAKAQAEVERIIFADEETRNKIRQDQLRQVAQIKNGIAGINISDQAGLQMPASNNNNSDLSLTTPYGPPSSEAFIIEVPKDCVGLVIGKQGETIRMLQERSGATRVQVALENKEGSTMRNVFVEGSKESVEIVRKMLAEIVDNQKKMQQGLVAKQTGGRVEHGIPHNMVGLVVGKGGETVKQINAKTGAFVILSREPQHENQPKKIFLITGTPEAIEAAKLEIDTIVDNGIKFQQNKMNQMAAGAQQQQIPPNPNIQSTNPILPGFPQQGFGNQPPLFAPPLQNSGSQHGLQLPSASSSTIQQQNKQQNQSSLNNSQQNLSSSQKVQQGNLSNSQQSQQTTQQQQPQQQNPMNMYNQQQMFPHQGMMPPQQGGFMSMPSMFGAQQNMYGMMQDGPQIEEIGADEAGEKRRRRKKK